MGGTQRSTSPNMTVHCVGWQNARPGVSLPDRKMMPNCKRVLQFILTRKASLLSAADLPCLIPGLSQSVLHSTEAWGALHSPHLIMHECWYRPGRSVKQAWQLPLLLSRQ